jgi:hypothetical protein
MIAAFESKAQTAGPDTNAHGFDCAAVADLGGEPAIICRRGHARIVLHGLRG